MMEIIGWLALAALLCSASSGWAALALNGLGKYNIGGVPNKLPTKLVLLVAGALLGYAWYALLSNSPFTVTLK